MGANDDVAVFYFIFLSVASCAVLHFKAIFENWIKNNIILV
jgi:hypothetical protein